MLVATVPLGCSDAWRRAAAFGAAWLLPLPPGGAVLHPADFPLPPGGAGPAWQPSKQEREVLERLCQDDHLQLLLS